MVLTSHQFLSLCVLLVVVTALVKNKRVRAGLALVVILVAVAGATGVIT
jgi:hypothetical protein